MKVGVGWSTLPSATEAALASVERALEASGAPALTILFTTDAYDQASVLDAVRGSIGTSRLVGFCGAGLLTAEGVFRQAVGVATLSGSELTVRTSLQASMASDPARAGILSAEELGIPGDEGAAVLVLPDGFASGVTEMLRSLYDRLGPGVRYLGGGAGDNLRFFKTWQFTERGVESGAVASASVRGAQIGCAIGHGWKPKGDLLVVTRSLGKRILELDARPAFEVYSGRLGGIHPKSFPEWGMRYPLGTADIRGNYLIRDPVSVRLDQSIDLVTEIPENAVAHIMEGTVDDLVDAASLVARAALAQVASPRFALVFDCISRYLYLGEAYARELRAMRESFGEDLPMLGALSFGEIGGYTDYPQFHNKTLAVGVFGSGGPP